MTLDHHHLAIVSLTGSSLDVLGALYLAYDLLGGSHGPLRTLTRAVTYSAVCILGYAIPLGFAFGVCAGVATGVTVAIELARQARDGSPYPYAWELLFAALRGAGYGLGASFIYGPEFGTAFGALSFAGQAFAYSRGIRPGMDYKPRRSPAITRAQILAAVNRTAGYAVAGYMSAAVAHHRMHAVMFGVDAGLGIGAATAVLTALAPWIEWVSETLRDRTMGAAGIGLIFAGFGLQSVQYWVALFDVTIR